MFKFLRRARSRETALGIPESLTTIARMRGAHWSGGRFSSCLYASTRDGDIIALNGSAIDSHYSPEAISVCDDTKYILSASLNHNDDGTPRYVKPSPLDTDTRQYPLYTIERLIPTGVAFPGKIVTDVVILSQGKCGHYWGGFPTDRFVHAVRDPVSKAWLHVLAQEEITGKVHLVAERTGLEDKLGKPIYEAREWVSLPYTPPPSIKGNGINVCF